MVTLDVLKDVAPKKTRSLITQDLVDKINEWNEDPKLLGGLSSNMLSYIGVLKEGRFKITDYMNAVRFVSYKLIGHSDIDAYAITFPDRYQRLVDEGIPRTKMGPYVSMYTKNELVVRIFEQTIIPGHVLNQPMYQEALDIAIDIARNSRSDMARVNAVNTILNNTKAPEVAKLELNVSMDNRDSIAELRKATEELALAQLQSIKAGIAVKEIAESTIIEAEVEMD